MKVIDERIKTMATLQMAPKSAVPDLMLSQTRVIRAPRERVYEAWTNPEIMMQWIGPSTMVCPKVTLDVRVGGAYRIAFAPRDATSTAQEKTCDDGGSVAVGHYTQLVPNELLQFTWGSSWQPGEETVVTFMLKDVPGGTELTLIHENFLTEASRDGHNTGWAGSFDKLAALLEA
jgi:uncharacterized protein YndB with AHSA1/START domain